MATETLTTDVDVQATPVEQTSTVSANGIRAIGLGGVLGLVGTLLIYQHAIALGFTVYTILLLGGLFLHARFEKVKPVRLNILILVPLMLFFAVMLAIRSDFFLIFVNLCMGILAAVLLVYFFSSGNLFKQDILDYAFKTLLTSLSVWLHPFEEFFRAQRWLSTRPQGWKAALIPIVRGLIITVPIMLVFIVLFSSADPMFANLVERLISLITVPDVDGLIGYAVIGAVLGWTAIGGLAYALVERNTKRDHQFIPPVAHELIKRISLGFTETAMVLGGVVSVFAIFVALQFSYLLGGEGNLRTFNYAQYLRRGFSELVIAAVLTLGLVYGLNLITARKTQRQQKTFHGLATVLILLASVILFSAFQRLRIYEEAYGFTPQRLIVYVFILWLGVLFIGFTLSLYWRPHTINVFGLSCFVVLFGFAMTLDVINPDAFVAQQMVARNDIDPLHLASLSEEAIPVMVSLLDSPDPGVRNIMMETLGGKKSYLLNYSRDFRDFSLGTYNAMMAVEGVKEKLPSEYRWSDDIWTKDDFKELKKGMTFRTLIRRYGRPYFHSFSYDPFSIARGNITPQAEEQIFIEYRLRAEDTSKYLDEPLLDEYLFMFLDSSDGLTRACIGKTAQTCEVILD